MGSSGLPAPACFIVWTPNRSHVRIDSEIRPTFTCPAVVTLPPPGPPWPRCLRSTPPGGGLLPPTAPPVAPSSSTSPIGGAAASHPPVAPSSSTLPQEGGAQPPPLGRPEKHGLLLRMTVVSSNQTLQQGKGVCLLKELLSTWLPSARIYLEQKKLCHGSRGR